MTLGEKLQLLRRSRGLSQEQLAEALGVSRQAISKWECGDSAPDLDKLRAICTYFGVTSDYLIWESAEAAPQARAASTAEKHTDHAARRESVRTFVRENAHWAGYLIAIVGGALLVRMGISLLAMSLMLSQAPSLDGLAPDFSMLGMTAKLMLPYLLLYAAMIVGGLLLARWLKGRRERQKADDDL